MKKILLVLLCISCIGCATVMNNKTTEIHVSSEPQGAEVYFNNLLVGTTPLVTAASEQEILTVRLSKPGYKPAFKGIGVHTEWWWYVIGFPLAAIPMVIDLINHPNTLALNETDLNFVLERAESP